MPATEAPSTANAVPISGPESSSMTISGTYSVISSHTLSAASTGSAGSTRTHIGSIIGVALGGAGITLLCLLAIWLWRRRVRREGETGVRASWKNTRHVPPTAPMAPMRDVGGSPVASAGRYHNLDDGDEEGPRPKPYTLELPTLPPHTPSAGTPASSTPRTSHILLSADPFATIRARRDTYIQQRCPSCKCLQ